MIHSRRHFLLPVLLLSLAACGNKGGGGQPRPYSPPPAQPQGYPVPPTNQRGRIMTPPPQQPGPGQGPQQDPLDRDDDDGAFDQDAGAPRVSGGGITPDIFDTPTEQEVSPAPVAPRPAPNVRPRPVPSIAPSEDGGNLPPPGRPATPAPSRAWNAPAVDGSPAIAWLVHNVDPLMNQLESAGPSAQNLGKQVRITLAVGYMDGFHKKHLVYEGVDYGLNAAVDPFLRAAAEDVLARPCEGRLQLCGFELVAKNDVSSLYRRVVPGNVTQEVRVISGAVSPNHDQNIGPRAGEQSLRTQRARAVFAKAFQDSDLVLYVGHSRKGGGPDFAPPKLKNSDVDYPAYQTKREGAHLVLNAVSAQGRRTRALALLSCDSTSHFLNEIRQAGPDLQVVTVRGNIRGENLLAGALGAADLFLRQGQLAGLPSLLTRQDQIGGNIQVLIPAPTSPR